MKKKILIAEDHSLMRAGLRMLLQHESDNEVVGEADNGKEAIRLALALKPDLVMMDLTMPGTNGLDAIAEIRKRLPNARILVLTIHRTDEYIHEALRAGADGYVLKDAGQEELLEAVATVLDGKSYLSPDVSMKVINGYLSGRQQGGAPNWDKLTQREREVLKLVAEGHGNKYIAHYLSLSIKTVEKHRSNLMRKLDLHSTAGLTAYAIEKGLIEI